MKCKDCRKRVIYTYEYGDMRKIKKWVLCSYRPEQKLNPNSQPKWCPLKREVEE